MGVSLLPSPKPLEHPRSCRQKCGFPEASQRAGPTITQPPRYPNGARDGGTPLLGTGILVSRVLAELQQGFLTVRALAGLVPAGEDSVWPGTAPARCPHAAFPLSSHADAGPGGSGPPHGSPQLPSAETPSAMQPRQGGGSSTWTGGDCNQHRWNQEGTDAVGVRRRRSGGMEHAS